VAGYWPSYRDHAHYVLTVIDCYPELPALRRQVVAVVLVYEGTRFWIGDGLYIQLQAATPFALRQHHQCTHTL
jgi:hypothetical protein